VTFLAFLLMRKLRRGFRRLAYIRRLAEVAAEAAELDEPELVATLRQLVQAVIVHAPPGTGELAIEITASLSELTLPGPLLKRSSGGWQVVAGVRYIAIPLSQEPCFLIAGQP
jgi:hypothetical protein